MTLLCIYSIYDPKPDICYIMKDLFSIFSYLTLYTCHTAKHTDTQVNKNKVLFEILNTGDTSWGFADKSFLLYQHKHAVQWMNNDGPEHVETDYDLRSPCFILLWSQRRSSSSPPPLMGVHQCYWHFFDRKLIKYQSQPFTSASFRTSEETFGDNDVTSPNEASLRSNSNFLAAQKKMCDHQSSKKNWNNDILFWPYSFFYSRTIF